MNISAPHLQHQQHHPPLPQSQVDLNNNNNININNNNNNQTTNINSNNINSNNINNNNNNNNNGVTDMMNTKKLPKINWGNISEYENDIIIIDVWEHNLEQEMEYISKKVIQKYPFIAMDTEFPGVVAKPIGNFRTSSEYHYQTLRCNVNLLKLIQLGLTFSDHDGNLPPSGRCCWQFHFQFNIEEDIYAQDSIDLLTKSGINFKENKKKGIDVEEFGRLLTASGIVLEEEVRWISFHSAYDFGYLVKLLSNSELPNTENDFFDLLYAYFPKIYDIKYLMRSCENLKGGLNQLADDLKIKRIGPAHQAGSDSLLTLMTFFKMMDVFFDNNLGNKFIGILYGLGKGYDKKNSLPYNSKLPNNKNNNNNNNNNNINNNNHNHNIKNNINNNINKNNNINNNISGIGHLSLGKLSNLNHLNNDNSKQTQQTQQIKSIYNSPPNTSTLLKSPPHNQQNPLLIPNSPYNAYIPSNVVINKPPSLNPNPKFK